MFLTGISFGWKIIFCHNKKITNLPFITRFTRWGRDCPFRPNMVSFVYTPDFLTIWIPESQHSVTKNQSGISRGKSFFEALSVFPAFFVYSEDSSFGEIVFPMKSGEIHSTWIFSSWFLLSFFLHFRLTKKITVMSLKKFRSVFSLPQQDSFVYIFSTV